MMKSRGNGISIIWQAVQARKTAFENAQNCPEHGLVNPEAD